MKKSKAKDSKGKLPKRTPGRPPAGKKWHPLKGYIPIEEYSS